MSSDATATHAALHAVQPRHGMIARALAWEECRVGGMVALLCMAAGWLMLFSLSLQLGRVSGALWIRGDGLLTFTVFMMPMLLTLLLVLNPANSGHLMGGFPKRVLWLPAPVSLAVAVSLGMRTLFMAVAAAGIIGFTALVLDGGPPFTLVALFVLLFVTVQTLEWSRAAVSGLSSLLLGAVVALPLLFITGYNPFAWAESIAEGAGWGVLLPVLFAAVAAGYGVSVAAVRATRAGRRYGIPEVWEWPGYFERGGGGLLPAFRSPLAAQVWFEWKRFGWTLPFGTVLLTAFFSLAYALGEGGPVLENLFNSARYAVFPAVLLSALAHGARARVLGFRQKPGRPGFDYLLPRSSAEEALAKCLVSALALIPTAMIIILLQALFGSGSFYTDLVPYALERGIASPRELAWVVSSRGLLLLLFAWPLMAIGTRGMRWLILAIIAFELLALFPNRPGSGMDPVLALQLQTVLELVMPILLVTAALAAFALAWRRRLLGPGSLAVCGAIWLAAAWLLHGALPAGMPLRTAALECLAWAALVPLPFALIALDSARKRHGSAVTQAPGASTSTGLVLGPQGWGLVAAAALVTLWMGWPAEPSYIGFLRAEGAPTARADLNDLYPAVPDDENVALRYIALGEKSKELEAAFTEHQEAAIREQYEDDNLYWYHRVYGQSSVPMRSPLDPDRMALTRAYWAAVTSHLVPELREIARQGPHRSRYPMDLRDAFGADLSHLALMRDLARQLSVDTVLASHEGDTARALDNLRATLALQESLANEPFLISGLVRIAILGIGVGQAEAILNLAPITEALLAELDYELRHALPPVREHRILEQPLLGERTVSVLIVVEDRWGPMFMNDEISYAAASSPLNLVPVHLAIPKASEGIVLLSAHERTREYAAEMARAEVPDHRFWEREPVEEDIFHIAPMASIMLPALFRAYGAEWRIRMQIDIARTGIAAERYRRAYGRWPASLDELTPAYIEAIPVDVHALEPGTPVRHTAHEDGAFTVYSVGMSGEDHGGRGRTPDDRRSDDLLFTLAP